MERGAVLPQSRLSLLGSSLRASHLPSPSFRPRTLFNGGKGLLSRDHHPFPGLPPGLLGAPPAMPLLTGPALSTALLQLALQTQGQKVTQRWAWASPSATCACIAPFAFRHYSHLPIARPHWSCGLSGCVPGAQYGSLPVTGVQVSGSDSFWGRKSWSHRGVEWPLTFLPCSTHTQRHTKIDIDTHK